MNASSERQDVAKKSAPVQVFIPVYNDAVHFPRALASVLGQKGVEVEVIVSDNASTDGSYEQALKVAAGDRRVKVFRNSSNIGAFPNWNLFSEYVTSDYYMLLCSDDALGDTNALQRARDILDHDPEIVSVYSDLFYVDGKDRKLARRHLRPTGVFDSRQALRSSFLSYRNCFGISLLSRRSAYEDLRYPERLTYVADVFLAARGGERGRLFHIAEPLIWNRYTGKNLTARYYTESARQFAEMAELLDIPLSRSDRLRQTLRLAMLLPSKYLFLKFAKLRS
jgi:glycosyltransferase involved in cell wall biosynthesis